MSLRSKLIKDKINRYNYYNKELLIYIYKSIVNDVSFNNDFRFFVLLKLISLLGNNSVTKIRNRCVLTSRPNGVYRFFKLSRLQIRKLGGLGYITGLKRSSW